MLEPPAASFAASCRERRRKKPPRRLEWHRRPRVPNPLAFSVPDEGATPFLSPERLEVYRLAIEFQRAAASISSNRRVGANLRDQFERASVSIVLCIAEGAGRGTPRDKAHFFTIARGSATECGAILDLLEARSLLSAAAHRHGRGQLIRIAQMLTRLIARRSA